MDYRTKKEILDKFYKFSFPQLKKFEQTRINNLKKLIIAEFLSIAVVAVYLLNFGKIYNFCAERNCLVWSYTLIVCIISFMVIYPLGAWAEFENKIKKALMPEVIGYFKNIIYSTSDMFQDNELIKSTLFSRFNRKYTGDSFNGNYNGVNFRISETRLELKEDKYNYSCFSGVIISFDSNKTIKAKTIITTICDFNTRNRRSLVSFVPLFIPIFILIYWVIQNYSFVRTYNAGANSFIKDVILPFLCMLAFVILSCFLLLWENKKQTQKFNVNRKKIKLEDPEFARQFEVYSEDQVEARYLVTPAFMERFKKLNMAFGTNKAKCAFYDDKVMFAISTGKNLFEFGSLFKTLNNLQNIGFFNELFSILDMIDYFKLNEKTGL